MGWTRISNGFRCDHPAVLPSVWAVRREDIDSIEHCVVRDRFGSLRCSADFRCFNHWSSHRWSRRSWHVLGVSVASIEGYQRTECSQGPNLCSCLHNGYRSGLVQRFDRTQLGRWLHSWTCHWRCILCKQRLLALGKIRLLPTQCKLN